VKYKPDELKNSVLITHKGCSDGSGCAVVFLLAGGKKENIHYVPAGNGVRDFYKKNQDVFETHDRVIIADVACDTETADLFEKLYHGDITIIDHHKTALDLKDRDWCHINMEKCGTFLLYDYLFENGEPDDHWGAVWNFAEMINDRDMWIRKDPKSDQLSLFANFFGQEKFVDMMTYRIRKCYPLMTDADLNVVKVLESKRDKYIEKHSEKPFFKELDGVKCAYVFCSDHQSQLLQRVMERHDCDVAIGIKLNSFGGVASIRSTEKVDATEIAKQFGGGGHARAAGHPIDRKTIEELLEVIHP